MNVMTYIDEHTDSLFDFILEFFNRDTESANVAWYFFTKRKIGLNYQTETYKVLTRIAKLKFGSVKRKPVYTGEVYLKAMKAVRKIVIWIQRTWMKARHLQIQLNSENIRLQTTKLLNSGKPLHIQYAILFNLIENWKPFTGVVKKQVL
jgi:hypothetical protein